ncbi:MAG: hypothetical protein RIR70_1161 [Pseudomonadota bacterium]|jgi:flagellar export protein FliJ
MIKTLQLMLRLLNVQEEKRLVLLKRARGELDRVQGVVSQLDNYAREYRLQMVSKAQAGSTPAELMATLDFERKLAQTAHSQKLVVGQLEENLDRAKADALRTHLQADGLKKILGKRLAALAVERDRLEAREIEESIAARKIIGGMNDASDRSS